MSDSLTVFGTDYTGVTGIKAKGTGNGTLTYIRPTGTKSISANGTGIDVTEYASVDVSVPTGTARTSSDLTVSGATVTAPAGLYASAASASVASGELVSAIVYFDDEPSVSVDSRTGIVTVSGGFSDDISPISTSGWVDSSQSIPCDIGVSGTYQLSTQAAATITPSTSAQTAVAAGKYTTGAVTVAAMPAGTVISAHTPQYLTAGYDFDTATGTFYAFAEIDDLVRPVTQSGYVDTSAQIYVSGTSQEETFQLETQAATTITPTTSQQTAVAAGKYTTGAVTVAAMPSGTAGTPTATKGSVSNHSVSVTPSVTNTTGYITGSTKTGTAVSVSASELVSGTYTVSASGTHDVTNYASASVAAGGATASATKGTVSNHSMSVTPSVTRTAGYVTAGSANGTAVTVSASELVSGSQTLTTNDTYDVTNLASVVVDVSGGGSTRELIVPQQTVTPSSYQVVLSNVSGLFIGGHYVVTYDGTEYLFSAGNLWGGNQIVVGEQTYYYDHSTRTDEIAPFGLYEAFNDITRTPRLYAKDNNSHTIKVERIDRDGITTTTICPQQTVTTDSSKIGSLSNTTAQFVEGDYYLVTYDGTEWMLTAAELWGETFGVGDDMTIWNSTTDDSVYPFFAYNSGQGMAFYAIDANASHTIKVEHIDSIPDALVLTTKTITANGTYNASSDNATGYSSVTVNVSGGGGSPSLQAKTATPTETQQTVLPDSGYDGLSQVTVNAIPSDYVGTEIPGRESLDLTVSGDTVTVPSGYYGSQASASVDHGTAGTPTATKGSVSNHSVSVTPSVTNTTGYITGGTKTGTAVTVSASELVSGSETKTANGTYDVTNLAELVVNVSGSSKNVQVAQSTSRVASTSYTKTASLTCAVSGKYDVYWDCFRSSTGNGTNGSQLYIGGSAYGSANTTFSSSIHVQSNHLTNVQINAEQEVAVYVRSRATNYYAYCGQLTIVQTA